MLPFSQGREEGGRQWGPPHSIPASPGRGKAIIMSEQHAANGNGKHTSNGRQGLRSFSAAELERNWQGNLRWQGIERPYGAEDVIRLRGSIKIEYTLARLGAERLWNLLHAEPYVAALGALTGNQAVQQVKA